MHSGGGGGGVGVRWTAMLQSADLAGDGAWDIDLLFLGGGGVGRESGLGGCTVVSGGVCLCVLEEEGSGGGAVGS